MLHHTLNFLGIGVLSAVLAVAAIICTALRIDKDPAVDGPRALISEFIGLWLAFTCLAWSFMIAGPANLQWALRGLAVGAALVAFAFAAYFAGTPEVRIRLDEEPSGFDDPTTSLNLDDPPATLPSGSDVQRHKRTWTELDNSTN
ncbi:MAG: hypothetical protein WCA10_13095 [Terracidiphilus sp.]